MIRRLFARLVIIALIGLCGYKEWQVRQLRGEVARLTASQKTRAASQKTLTASQKIVGKPNRQTPVLPNGWLDRAELHAQKAKDALARGDFKTAQRETERLKATMAEPQQRTAATISDARRRFDALQNDVKKLSASAQDFSKNLSQENTP